MNTVALLIVGVGIGIGGRALLARALLAKYSRDVTRLNAGDYRSVLANYAEGAVLRFDDGDHRWSGAHVGRAAIERFLREFTRAGLQGRVRGLCMSGPPWQLTLLVRFDDRAVGPDNSELYANRAVLLVRTRWGKVVEQEDFYVDTRRIDDFETRLETAGIHPVADAENDRAGRAGPREA